jgi:hypothetical protein
MGREVVAFGFVVYILEWALERVVGKKGAI